MEIYFLPLQQTSEADFVIGALSEIDYVDVFRLKPLLIACLVNQNYDFYHEHPFSSLLEMLLSDGEITPNFVSTMIETPTPFSKLLLSEIAWESVEIDITATTFEQFIFPLTQSITIKNSIEETIDDTLCETINIFLKNNLNVLQTARQMFVHRNTLNYRLSMIQKQTGINVRTFHGAVFFFTLLHN